MKKMIKIGIISIVAIIAIVIVFFSFFVGKSIKVGVETVGPRLTKTPVSLGSVNLSILSGSGELNRFIVGNPEGFHTPEAISMGQIKLDIDTSSIFSDNIVVEEVLIDGAEITFEGSLRGSNIKKIMDNIDSMSGRKGDGDKPASKDDDSAEEGEKKIQINKLVFKNGKIHMSSQLLRGQSITIPLPDIERNDIGNREVSQRTIFDKLNKRRGKEVDYTASTVPEIVANMFRIIFEEVVSAVAESGKLGKLKKGVGGLGGSILNDNVKDSDDGVEKLKSTAKEKTSEAIDKLKGLFNK